MVGDIFQPTHLLFVLVVALLVLGPKRLPEVGRTLGSGIRDFRAAINGESTERKDEVEREREPWTATPEPDDKHDFAHDAEPVAEVAHDIGSGASETPKPPAEANGESGKHEFAYDSSDAADDPAPRG